MLDPIRLKPDDRPADDPEGQDDAARAWVNRSADSDALSALTEAELLQIAGKVGAIKAMLLRTFDHPMRPEVKRLVRLALGHANEATTLSQAVLGSATVRRA